MRKALSLLAVAALALTGCAEGSGLSEREAGLLGGSALGAGLGAIVGNQTGHAGAGTAIGAGAGALAGALVGEGMRRQKESTKRDIREEVMQQQYQAGYAPQYTAQPQVVQPAASAVKEVHTKYNPRTGQSFPDRYQYDPATGEALKYLT